MKPCTRKIVFATLVGAVAGALSAETFYWQVIPKGWGNFADAANWSTTADWSSTDANKNETGAVPGEDDLVSSYPDKDLGEAYYYRLAAWNLQGASVTIGGYTAAKDCGCDYHGTRIDLTNGTLTVKNPQVPLNQARCYYIWDGATLVYPKTDSFVQVCGSGTMEIMDIQRGGRAEIYSKIRTGGATSTVYVPYCVRAGGEMIFEPAGFDTNPNNYGRGLIFENYGTFKAAKGIDWDGTAANYEATAATDLIRFCQKGGTFLLGGAFKKTGLHPSKPGEMRFELSGGTLEIENEVTFFTAETAKHATRGLGEQVFAEMPENANATVNVKEGGSIDLSPFTYGSNAVLVKSGPGLAIFAARPATLSVTEGTVAFATTLADLSGLTLADGVTVRFDAIENQIAALDNADKITFAIGDGLMKGDTVVTAGSAELAQTIASRMAALPASLSDCKVEVDGTSIVLASNVKPVLTLTVRDFTLPVGSAPTNNGFTVSGLLRKDTFASATSGTAAYSLGGYTAESAAGDYTVTLSGLTSETYEIVFVAGKMTVVDESAVQTYYWKGTKNFLAFNDLANWTYDAAGTVAATRLPCAYDSIWNKAWEDTSDWSYHTGYWDLGGGSYIVSNFVDGTTGPLNTWKNSHVQITNGTLTVLDPTFRAASSSARWYTVWNGGRLIYPAGTPAVYFAASGLTERWTIKEGGYGALLGGTVLHNDSKSVAVTHLVEKGGTLLLDPTSFSMSSYNDYGVTFENHGTLLLPHGLNWDGYGWLTTAYGATADRLHFVQKEGRMLLGGLVTRTGAENSVPADLTFEFVGGTLEVTNDVTFVTAETAKNAKKGWGEQVFATLPADAALTVDVKIGSTLDLQPFTFGANAALTQIGAGTLLLGSERPSSLSMQAGRLVFLQAESAYAGLTVTAGATFVFGMPGNAYPTCAGADAVNFSVTEDYTTDTILLTCADDATATAAAARTTLPAALQTTAQVVALGNKVVIRETAGNAFFALGETDLKTAANWPSGVPEGATATLHGNETIGLLSDETPAFSKIVVEKGARLKVTATHVDLPVIEIAADGSFELAAGAWASLSNGLVTAGNATQLPIFAIDAGATLAVPGGTEFKNCDVRLDGFLDVQARVNAEGKYVGGGHYVTFGAADNGETTYFAMQANGGRIRVGRGDDRNFRFIHSQTSGTVRPGGRILLKDLTFDTNGSVGDSGAWFGYGVTRTVPVDIELDNTTAEIVRTSVSAGGARLHFTNNARYAKRATHPGSSIAHYSKGNCQMFFENGAGFVYSRCTDPVLFNPDVVGLDAVTVGNGGYFAVHAIAGNGKGVFVASNGTWCVESLRKPTYDVPAPNDDARNWVSNAFTGFASVRIEKDSKLYLRTTDHFRELSVDDQVLKSYVGLDWDRATVLADIPITGEGSLVVENGIAGWPFTATVVNGANTATGTAGVENSQGIADPTHLVFNDGANWAGTVLGDEHIALTNLAAAASPATVSFAGLRLTGTMPLRYWEDDGVITSDTINLATALTGTGAIRPVACRGRAGNNATVELGRYPKAAGLPDAARAARGWTFVTTDIPGDDDYVTLGLKRDAEGLILLIE